MLVGVFIGVQTAGRGYEKVSPPEQNGTQAQYIAKVDNGKVVKQPVHASKQANQPPHVQANFVSSAGLAMGGWVKNTTRSSVGWLAGFFQP